MNKRTIKYTPEGFSYIDVDFKDCASWGGLGICDGCNNGPFNELKLIYVLHDTYCNKCFNEWLKRCKSYSKADIEYDLNIQNQYHISWYEYHLGKGSIQNE